MSKELGEKYSYLVVPDFNRVGAMQTALRQKFIQYPELAQLLIATKERPLYYHSLYDDYWADGGDGSGKNMLGKLLMQIREEIKMDF